MACDIGGNNTILDKNLETVWKSLLPFVPPPPLPFCTVVVATELCNHMPILQREREVHRCFKDFGRGLKNKQSKTMPHKQWALLLKNNNVIKELP